MDNGQKKAGRGVEACEHVRSRWHLAVAMEGDEQEAIATSTQRTLTSLFLSFPLVMLTGVAFVKKENVGFARNPISYLT